MHLHLILLSEWFAIKYILVNLTEVNIDDIKKEAEVLLRLFHPYIIQVRNKFFETMSDDEFLDDGVYFCIAMDFYEVYYIIFVE